MEITSNGARVRRVDRPQDEPILVALDRLRRYPEKIPDEFLPKDNKSKSKPKKMERSDGLNSLSRTPQDVHVPSDITDHVFFS